jgi:hypothetical protein
VGYDPREQKPAASHEPRIIVIAVEDEAGGLRFYIHPKWKSMVASADRDYVASVIRDLERRARADAEGLFTQLSSIQVGPLVTCEYGESIDENGAILSVLNQFEEF